MRALVQRLTTSGSFPLRGGAVAIIVSSMLLACNQDAASSNEDRDTHMGSIRAVAPPSADSAPAMVASAVPPTASAAAPPASASTSAISDAGSAGAVRDAGSANAARTADAPDAARPAAPSSGAPAVPPQTKKP